MKEPDNALLNVQGSLLNMHLFSPVFAAGFWDDFFDFLEFSGGQ